jgi:transcriptional regulator with XRE-family HTH domain
MTDEEILRPLKAVRHSSYADRIRKRSLTMSDVARETGISRETLHKIASGKLPIGPSTRAALRTYFECGGSDGERRDVCSVAVSTGSGAFLLNFGPKMPR